MAWPDNLTLSPFPAKNLKAFADDISTQQIDFSNFPGLAYTFAFERWLIARLDTLASIIHEHTILPIGLALVYYLVIVDILPRYIAKRKGARLVLRFPLVVWNTSLAVFSILGSVRIIPELVWTWTHFGFHGSACSDKYVDDPRVFLWFFLFTFSKVAEFGDTLFLVLRGQRVIPLHWVHHMLTLVFTWHNMVALPAHSRWLCGMNYVIHSFMYTYYAVMASGLRVPKSWAQHLTTAQILQMVMGLVLQVQALWLGEQSCHIPRDLALFGFVIYAIFFVMFVNLFIDKYLRKPKPKKA